MTIILLICNSAFILAQPTDDGYISIKGAEHSLGVNMRFIPPQGWKEIAPIRPHVVKNYINPIDGSGMNILISELPTFVSRNEFKESMNDFYLELYKELKNDSYFSSFIELSHQFITLDKYPFVEINAMVESQNNNHRYIFTTLITVYEDKRIHINFYIMSSQTDYTIPKKVINSVVFPDQYLNY